jgi:hypothetical protein
MEAKDILTLTVSSAALAVALMTAARSWRSNRATLRSAGRNNYMNALFNINRELIAHPDLWSVYDPDWPRAADYDSPTEVARRRGFIWYHINLFELFYADYHHHRLGSIDSADRQYWDSWDKYIRSFLKCSEEARAVVLNDDSMELLHRDFRDYLRSCLPSHGQAPRSRPATLATYSRGAQSRACRDKNAPQESTMGRSSIILLMMCHRPWRVRSARHHRLVLVQHQVRMRR